MGVRERWKQSSGTAKTVFTLAMLLLLQIGVCFATPTATPWICEIFHIPASNDPYNNMGMMALQAFLAAVTFILLFFAWFHWREMRKHSSTQHKRDSHD